MNKQFTDEQIAEFKEAFSIFDINGDDTILIGELGNVMRSLSQCPSEAEMQEIIKLVGPEGKGTIEFPQFLSLMARQINKIDTDVLVDMDSVFREFDKDRNGLVSYQELKHVLKQKGQDVSDEQIEKMMNDADKDDDGMLNYMEFVAMVSTNKYGIKFD